MSNGKGGITLELLPLKGQWRREKRIQKGKLVKPTFKPRTLLALSAITAPDRPAPTTTKLRKVEQNIL